jgi:hypothetical protein
MNRPIIVMKRKIVVSRRIVRRAYMNVFKQVLRNAVLQSQQVQSSVPIWNTVNGREEGSTKATRESPNKKRRLT